MDITFTLPDGSRYKPFTTVGEVKTFFRISDDDFLRQPNRSLMDQHLSNLYKDKVRPQEEAIFYPQKEFVKEFFQQNVWGMVNDSDTIDTLIAEIRSLADMGIEGINQYVCEDVIEWIIMNVIGTNRTLSDWGDMNLDERNQFTVDILDKNQFTDYFVELVVEYPWEMHQNNSYRMMDKVRTNIRTLYVVDPLLKKEVCGKSRDFFRNTRYL